MTLHRRRRYNHLFSLCTDLGKGRTNHFLYRLVWKLFCMIAAVKPLALVTGAEDLSGCRYSE